VLVAFCVHGAQAHADAAEPRQAQESFEQARRDMKQGNYARARDLLVESLRHEISAGTLINLALCEEKLGHLNDALRRLREATELDDVDHQRQALVAKLIAALTPRIPRLTIRVEGEARGVDVALDGKELDVDSAHRDVQVDPGDHEIVARASDGHTYRFQAHVEEGETKPIALIMPAHRDDFARASAIEAGKVEFSPRPKASAQLGAVGIGAGGLGLAAGMVMGFMTLGRKIKVDDHCDANGCDAEGRRASEEGNALGIASTIATAAGLAAVGAGSYLVLRDGGPASAPNDASFRHVGYGAAVVGGIGLTASALTAAAALAAEGERQDHCDVAGCRNPEGIDAASRGRTYSTVSTVAFGIGVGGLGVAAYSLLFRPLFAKAPDSQLSLSPSGVMCRTRF
jgi:hypothetical protein